MKRTWYKIIGLIKKIFIGLLTGLVNGCNHRMCVSLSNQKCEIQSTLTNLHPNEYSEKFHYYPLLVKLDRCAGSCETINDLSNKACVLNKIEKNMFGILAHILWKQKIFTKYYGWFSDYVWWS